MCPTSLFYADSDCPTPNDFTHQGESAITQWVKQELTTPELNLIMNV
jgi:hypothetical protein